MATVSYEPGFIDPLERASEQDEDLVRRAIVGRNRLQAATVQRDQAQRALVAAQAEFNERQAEVDAAGETLDAVFQEFRNGGQVC